MDSFQFISSLVDSLAWPLVFLFVYCTIWYYFPKLAPFVRQLKYGDIELTFGQQVEAVAEASAALVLEPTSQEPASPKSTPRARPAPDTVPLKKAHVEMGTESLTAAELGAYMTSLGAGGQAFDPDQRGDVRPDERENLVKLTEISPRSAVLLAWMLVERSAKWALGQTGSDRLEFSVHLLSRLEASGFITDAQMDVLVDLFNLRNSVEHNEKLALSPKAARQYVDAAINLTNSLRVHPEWRLNPSDEY